MNLLEALTNSDQIALSLDKDVNGLDVPETDRAKLCGALLDVSHEHHKAVTQLLRNKFVGSASALARVLYETTIRAMWLHRCATEEEISKFKEDSRSNATHYIKALKTEGIDLEEWHEAIWPVLNSYAHSGYRQARSRLPFGEISPIYDEIQQVELLMFSDFILYLAAVETFKLTGKPELEKKWLKPILLVLNSRPNGPSGDTR